MFALRASVTECGGGGDYYAVRREAKKIPSCTTRQGRAFPCSLARGGPLEDVRIPMRLPRTFLLGMEHVTARDRRSREPRWSLIAGKGVNAGYTDRSCAYTDALLQGSATLRRRPPVSANSRVRSSRLSSSSTALRARFLVRTLRALIVGNIVRISDTEQKKYGWTNKQIVPDI